MSEYKDEIGIMGGTAMHTNNTTSLGFEYGDITWSNGTATVQDAWRQELRYSVTANLESYSLWSVGPDGSSGTADDIGRGSYTE